MLPKNILGFTLGCFTCYWGYFSSYGTWTGRITIFPTKWRANGWGDAGATGQVHGDLSWVPTTIYFQPSWREPLKMWGGKRITVHFFTEKSRFTSNSVPSSVQFFFLGHAVFWVFWRPSLVVYGQVGTSNPFFWHSFASLNTRLCTSHLTSPSVFHDEFVRNFTP